MSVPLPFPAPVTPVSRSVAATAYRESEVLAASPGRLLVITYDALVSSLTRARVGLAMQKPDVAASGFDRSRLLLGELLATLNHEAGGDIAARLAALYVFLLGEIDSVALHGDTGQLDRYIGMIQDIRDAFATISAPAGGIVS